MEVRALTEEELDSAYDVVSIPERTGNKWVLYDGETNIDAIMEDTDFQRMFENNNLSIHRGDVMICDIEYNYEELFKNEHRIVEVFEIASLRKEDVLN